MPDAMTVRAWFAGSGVGLLVFAAAPDAAAALDFARYLGGAAEDTCRDVAFDAAGNLYAVGGTKSTNFVTTDGTTLNSGANGAGSGAHDIWVAKFDPAGRLLWSTLIGGNGYDRAYAVEVNAAGVTVAGRAGVGFRPLPARCRRRSPGMHRPRRSTVRRTASSFA
jgi:hypothetical protein